MAVLTVNLRKHSGPTLTVETSHQTLSNRDYVPLHFKEVLEVESNSTVFFSLVCSKMSLALFLVQNRICLCVMALGAQTPMSALYTSNEFFNGFYLTVLLRQQLPLLLVEFFLPHLFLQFNFLRVFLDITLFEQPGSSATTFCGLPFLCRIIKTSAKSAVFSIIVWSADPD